MTSSSAAQATVNELSRTATAVFDQNLVQGELDFDRVVNASRVLGFSLEEKEVRFLFNKTVGNNVWKLNERQFKHLFTTPYDTTALLNAYRENVNREGALDARMLHKALALIGVQDFTELEAAKLTDRFADLLRSTPPGIVSFDLWCRITSPASLLLAKEKISQDVVPTVFETMAYIQTIAGAMVGVLFGFLPKPTTDFHTAATTTLAATANTTITRLPFPLIYDPLKNDSHRAVDCATLILILMWAGFFIWSLRRRGTVLGQRYGYASLACATGVVSILLATINPELIIVFVLCLAVFGVGVVRLG